MHSPRTSWRVSYFFLRSLAFKAVLALVSLLMISTLAGLEAACADDTGRFASLIILLLRVIPFVYAGFLSFLCPRITSNTKLNKCEYAINPGSFRDFHPQGGMHDVSLESRPSVRKIFGT